ncbi:TPA: preprotein translocase subunit SecA [bacterium]|nr:preprotein translocase subunit SecA [bacterium]
MGFLSRLFNTEKKHFQKVQERANQVLALEEKYAAMSDEELQAMTPYFRNLLSEGKTLDDILPDAFATSREAAKRVLGEFPYPVQVIGAVVLHDGDVAEMKTGEGKTLTSTMCIYLNALEGKGVHVVTVNEYLAKRDAEWMGEIYRFLGLTVGVNLRELTPSQKKEAYLCDITYTTNSEVGFDYLRDNMVTQMNQRVLRDLHMAVIDEADSVLIDESRTPLIISGGAKQTANLYLVANRLAKSLKADRHYEIDIESKTVSLTEEGVHYAEKALGIDNLFKIEHTDLVHHIHNALKANYIMARDVDYVVQEGKVVIVDQFTGRLLVGRTYSDGLHQAIEAKEGVKIQQETTTLATITYQNFFRLYNKLAGMTGTAKTEEEEFLNIYNMRVIVIPTNKPIIREDAVDLVYAKKEYKYKAMLEEIKERHTKGQPILIGTIAVETSEHISKLLRRAGIKHEVLNAKNHQREADIIKKAGQKGAVTIATNMAGRGTDIKLGDGVRELGGLAVIGTERHESRRIDNQLRGRSGRQGDPGYSRFYVSLEDDLMLRFGGDRVRAIFKSLGEEALESKMISRIITQAQQRVEGYNYDVRKQLIQYDDVLSKQREIMYAQRDAVILQEDVHDVVVDMFKKVAIDLINNAITYESKEPLVDVEKLIPLVMPRYLKEGEHDLYELEGILIEEACDKLADWMIKKFEAKKEEWGEGLFRLAEKQILIRIIDRNWTNHIDAMTKLREGIHLRAYAQTDPLQHYTHEGYEMFEQLKSKIAVETVTYCINAEVRTTGPKK